ncbi:MAG: hypothetical protein M1812_007691 [Candelaria pacifica]|nr:MAG: hypothetical protein M1812_007691 [Candelaria pacifica]
MRSSRNILAGKSSNASLAPPSSSSYKAAGPHGLQRSGTSYMRSEARDIQPTSWRAPDPRHRQTSRLGNEYHPISPILEKVSPQGSSGGRDGGDGWSVAAPRVKSRVGSQVSQAQRGSRNGPPNSLYQASKVANAYSMLPPNRTKSTVGGLRAISALSHLKQSALPVSERDPELVEIEKNAGTSLNKDSFIPGFIFRAVLHER